MTKEELAAQLTGGEIGDEITLEQEAAAKVAGLVVIFGASDDLVELRGAIYDELGAWNGTTLLVRRGHALAENGHSCDCDFCGYPALKNGCAKVEALWCKEGDYSWTYKTDLPHATFEIKEDGRPYCRGIVINETDLPI